MSKVFCSRWPEDAAFGAVSARLSFERDPMLRLLLTPVLGHARAGPARPGDAEQAIL